MHTINPNRFAPIVLFVYNRPWHTRQTVEALQRNEFAGESDLFVYADGSKKPEHADSVREVREYVSSLTGFRSVTVIARDENFGLARSVITGVTDLVNRFGSIIVLEDDLVTSPYFLRYMNDALQLYEQEERVISIHGYCYPVTTKLPETFFLKGADCWGWATWKRGWDLFEPDGKKLLDELQRRKLTRQFDFDGAYSYTRMLEKQVLGQNNSWAICWHSSAFLNNKLTLYPGSPLVHNIGNDASGSHCGTSEKYDVALTSTALQLQPIPIEPSPHAELAFANYFRSLKPTFLEKLSNSLAKKRNKLFPRRSRKRAGYYGNYAQWDDAQRDSSGYDANDILEKVRSAMQQVRDGKAAYERDSVVFDKIQYSWPLVAALLWIASREQNRLRVIDFGGALGSSYYQNRGFLSHLATVNWNVVEQGAFVECGRNEFADRQLQFYPSIEDCQQNSPCETILFASVLPYLPDPYALLSAAMEHQFRYLIIDRTPVIAGRQDRLTVQVVPPKIYSASYPAWFLSEARLIEHLSQHYELVTDFDSLVSKIDLGDITAREKGYLFKRKELVNPKESA